MSLRRRGSIYDATVAGLYDLEQTIGRGHFAVVKLARHVFTGEKVAVKVIDKIKLDPVSREHLYQEVRCMKLVQHPNIVRLYEVIDTQTKLFLILELGDYDMYDYIMRYDRGVAEPEAQRYFCQIVQAISYCHQLHVVHRDLKPENVVFFEKLGMVKLTDFGFSNLFSPGEKLDTSCGSLAYSAPEILLGDSYDAPAVDVWSLGVILYMLVCGRLPFQETNDSETLTKILDCSFVLPAHLSEDCQSLIKRLLVREPAYRASLDEVQQNPWVVAGDMGHSAILPLVSRGHLSEENHSTILDQMAVGGISEPDEVMRALEKDEYNYITATYFLLAERLLRKERQAQAEKLTTMHSSSDSKLQLASLALSPRIREKFSGDGNAVCTCSDPSENCLCIQSAEKRLDANLSPLVKLPLAATTDCPAEGPASGRTRLCSIVQEESEEELVVMPHKSRSRGSSPRTSPAQSQSNINLAKTVLNIRRGSGTSSPTPAELQAELLELSQRVLTGGCSNSERSGGSRSPSPLDATGRTSPVVQKYKGVPPSGVSRKLPSVSSSPHLLEICEEAEEDDNGCGLHHHHLHYNLQGGMLSRSDLTYSAVRMIRPRQAVVSPDVIRRYERTTVGRSRRSTSASSSEASDDDNPERRYGLLPLNRGRKDSDPDDDVDPSSGGGGGGGGLLNGRVVSNGPAGDLGSSTTNGGNLKTNGSTVGRQTKQQQKGNFKSSLDPRKLAGRLQKLALAPIREIPHLFHSSFRLAANKLSWRANRQERDDLSSTGWLKSLEKPRSYENICTTRLSAYDGAIMSRSATKLHSMAPSPLKSEVKVTQNPRMKVGGDHSHRHLHPIHFPTLTCCVTESVGIGGRFDRDSPSDSGSQSEADSDDSDDSGSDEGPIKLPVGQQIGCAVNRRRRKKTRQSAAGVSTSFTACRGSWKSAVGKSLPTAVTPTNRIR